jgi:HCOMODA/2-hydroxy-3-carboxy-muconic semialdehyde decarboxylase
LVSPAKPLGLVVAEDKAVMVTTTGSLPAEALPEVVVHQAIYAARSDVGGIARFQSPHIMALSALRLTPRALHGFGAYFAPYPPLYDDPRLMRNADAATALVDTLGSSRAVIMRGNGAIAVGTSIEEAIVMAWYLEDAARVELAVRGSGLRGVEFSGEEARDRAILSGRLIERMWEWLTAQDVELTPSENRGAQL